MKEINQELLHPFYEELVELIGLENTVKFYEAYQGITLNVPKKLYSSQKVAEMIKEISRDHHLTKSEKQYYARQFDYSERQIERFIGE